MASRQRRVFTSTHETTAPGHGAPIADTSTVTPVGSESSVGTHPNGTGVATILAEVADLMRSGRCVAVLAGDEFVPVAVVSSLLQVPHDQARRLLVRGVIPCQVIARRRHALVSDVLAYRDQLRRAREVALDQLVEEAQLLGLGY